MNFNKVNQIYKNIELKDNSQFKKYIKSIVESIIEENTQEDLIRKIAGLDAMIKDRSTTPGEKENAAKLKKKLEDKLETIKSASTNKEVSDTQKTDKYDIFTDEFFKEYGFTRNEFAYYGSDWKYYEDLKNKDEIEYNGYAGKIVYRSRINPYPRKFNVLTNSDKERFVEFIIFDRDKPKR